MSNGSSRLAVAAAVAIAVAAALTGFIGPTSSVVAASFRAADGSTACAALESGAVACRRRGESRAVVLHRDGRAEARALRIAWTHATRVLLEAESWWSGDTVCRVAGAAVRCSAAGRTIALGGSRGAAPG